MRGLQGSVLLNSDHHGAAVWTFVARLYSSIRDPLDSIEITGLYRNEPRRAHEMAPALVALQLRALLSPPRWSCHDSPLALHHVCRDYGIAPARPLIPIRVLLC